MVEWAHCIIYMYTVHFRPSIEQRKQFFLIAKQMIWEWFGVFVMNGQIIYAFTEAF